MKVCIVIPAYNEGAAIGSVIRGIREEFKTTPHKATVVVVDDASQDNTAQEARNAGAVVIGHVLNSGAGGATSTGLSYANAHGYEVAATMDADGQHLAKDVVDGVNRIDGTRIDLLIGSRLIDSKGMSKVKVLGNRGLSLITYLLFGINTTDSQSGLRIFSARALRNLKWKTSGYEFCSEMLWRAKQLGLHVDEYPIKAVYTDYSKSKGQNNWNAINIVKSLLKRRIGELFG